MPAAAGERLVAERSRGLGDERRPAAAAAAAAWLSLARWEAPGRPPASQGKMVSWLGRRCRAFGRLITRLQRLSACPTSRVFDSRRKVDRRLGNWGTPNIMRMATSPSPVDLPLSGPDVKRLLQSVVSASKQSSSSLNYRLSVVPGEVPVQQGCQLDVDISANLS